MPRGQKSSRVSWTAAVVLGSVALAETGCAGTYLQNRWRDARDVFTLEVNTRAYGASARVGPLKVGAYYKSPAGFSGGLRGGHAGAYHSAEFTAGVFGADYFSERPLLELLPPKAPKQSSEKSESKAEVAGQESPPESEPARGKSKTKPDAADAALLSVQRRKAFRARAPFGTTAPAHANKSLLKEKSPVFTVPTYFTQMEVSLGVFGGVKLGFNPGELLDFLLGWFTIDLYGDDAPFPDPRLEKLRRNPLFRDLDPKTQERILKEMEDGALFPGLQP